MEELTKQLEAINKTLELILQRLPVYPLGAFPNYPQPMIPQYPVRPWWDYSGPTAAPPRHPVATMTGVGTCGVATSGYIQAETGHG